jgi:hypothetical protein
MMLIVAIAIWLIVALFFVVLCRGAASADGRDTFSTGRYPSARANDLRADVAAIVLGKDRSAPTAAEVRPRARGARGHAGQYAARS